jgi:hypothetical protein
MVLPIAGDSGSQPANKEVEEGSTENGAACWGAETLHQVKMVPHPNHLLPGGPSAQRLPS